MTLRDYIFPPSRCSTCDRPLHVMFITLCDCGDVNCFLCRAFFCCSCGLDQQVINPYLTMERWVKFYDGEEE